MSDQVIGLDELDATMTTVVGGKAANLGELTKIDGVRVPAGFCVTTEAFRTVVGETAAVVAALDRLSQVDPGDRDATAAAAAEVRAAIVALPLPASLARAIGDRLARLPDSTAYAVRSSATAEDLVTASFAGLQDSYLDVVGSAAVLKHVARCWASLFTERAVTYRLRHGIDHRDVRMAVIVQEMVHPAVAGILFTADPVSSDRTVTAVEAVTGLAEDLAAGLVDPDVYRVRGDVVERPARVSTALTEAQVLRLAQLGRRIETWFGRPQDIEWCLVDAGADEPDVRVVQSRPITTLFPVPDAGDDGFHVYLSVGHQQMMTDPMMPLGLSIWHLTTSAAMVEAGARLFVDVTRRLASPSTRGGFLELVGTGDPLTGDALRTVLDRDGLISDLPEAEAAGPRFNAPTTPTDVDPALVDALIRESEESLAALRTRMSAVSGPALFDAMEVAFEEDKRLLFAPRSMQVIMAGMAATTWLNTNLEAWLGERGTADTFAQSAPHNVTSEMGLALLDVADALRPYPGVIAYLTGVSAGDDAVLDGLADVTGGVEARAAIEAFLERYGMRCAGEIDITRPRWAERPAELVPLILGNLTNFAPGEAVRRFSSGLERAHEAQRDVLARVGDLPDGDARAAEVSATIARLRTVVGYREYPKYNRVCRAFVHKQALLREADRLVADGVLGDRDDVFHLRFDELREVVRTRVVDDTLLARRKEEFRSALSLTTPRVLTSDGECLVGAYRREDLPAGGLAGLAVSSGTVEGRARVVLDMARADLAPGDILVTRFTDPSWTPLFVTVAGLVTEVGGLMTHGAVIAREYGLPAVVGVDRAIELIRDGQRIRVHGAEGYVELL